MKNLSDIIEGLAVTKIIGSTDVAINSLQFDSRKVNSGDCFFAIKGVKLDGHKYIESVIEKGATAIVCETLPAYLQNGVCYLQSEDVSKLMGEIASAFYDFPSKQLKLVGVTGTNGKTTTATLLFDLFRRLGKNVGLLSTVVNKINETEIASTHTTPDSIGLNSLLRKMVDEGCTHCFIEVSSHAVVQNRIAALHFSGGVFTNITHEHLDYHKTFDAYIKAKRSFFNMLSKSAFALSNKDDKCGEVMLQETKAKKCFYALKNQADYKAKIIESNFHGLYLKLDGQEFHSPLIGTFNAYNLLSVYATAVLCGEDKMEVLTALSTLKSVSGRFQYSIVNQVIGIVDYAHSPDALENVLKTIKNIRTSKEEVITVVGCGGDRDRAKRPIMAAIACKYSDRVVLTSDNPRTEKPEEIIEEMRVGVEEGVRRKVLAISDRREAIRTASSLAKAQDIILLAGKGHETYQEINGVRNHFDDTEELINALNQYQKN